MEQLKLSNQLLDELQKVLVSADERAEDSFIAAQYFAAINGYIVGRQEMPGSRKLEFFEKITAFSKHVMDDVHRSTQEQAQRQGNGASQSTEAFGIWKPGA